MAILYSSTLKGIKLLPELDGNTNVVRSVLWEIKFYDEDYEDSVFSIGMVETILDHPTDTFVPLDTASQADIISWAIAKEGDEFIPNLQQGHTYRLEYMQQLAGTVDYDISTLD